MKEGKAIYAVTTLNNELYVNYMDSTDITINDSETYIAQRTLQVPLLAGANDMTSCKKHQCIYITDCVNDVVHRVDNKITITQWPVNDMPCGLSVNPAHNLLVTFVFAGEVKEFTTEN